jgi:hypothetical protein
MGTSKFNGWFTGRNRWLMFGSIAAVGITGAIAVGANIGILNAANNTTVGKVDTAAQLTVTSAAPAGTAPNTTIVDVYVTDPTTTGAATTAATAGQVFDVDVAGKVTLNTNASGLHLGDVSPTAGWTWSLNQPGATQLTVTFTNGTRTLVFQATLGADGKIQANVSEPIVQQAPSGGGNVTPAPQQGDDHYEGGGSDD